MDAKKLTMAVSFMMVLAAAFVLVVPSESDDAASFEITDAKFMERSKDIAVKVTLSDTVNNGSVDVFFGADVIKHAEILPGANTVKTSVGTSLETGTYLIVVNSEKGNDSIEITWPTVVSYNIVVSQSQGGVISTDKQTATPGEVVTITATPADGYVLTALVVNGTELAKGTNTFPMPESNVTVSAVFSAEDCTVTLVIADGFSSEVKTKVGEPMQAPAAPAIKGAEFKAWTTADGAEFDFTQPIEDDITLYAVYGPEAPSKEQTSKFVAAMSDECDLVLTAYDGNIIGKGSATVTVYKAQTIRGIQQYIPAGSFEVTIDSDDAFCIADLADDVDKITAKAAGSYAVSAVVTLTNGTVQLSNYATFVEPNEQI